MQCLNGSPIVGEQKRMTQTPVVEDKREQQQKGKERYFNSSHPRTFERTVQKMPRLLNPVKWVHRSGKEAKYVRWHGEMKYHLMVIAVT